MYAFIPSFLWLHFQRLPAVTPRRSRGGAAPSTAAAVGAVGVEPSDPDRAATISIRTIAVVVGKRVNSNSSMYRLG